MNNIEYSIKVIQDNDVGDYVVAFSGGKDSIVVLDLMKKSGVSFESIFNVTTIDPPEVYDFIRENFPDVKWVYPKQSMYQLICEKGLPTRLHRWCCEDLKHSTNADKTVVTGVRKMESTNRRGREAVEINQQSDIGKKIINPIVYWSDDDVWDYIRSNKLLYPSLYDKGHKRIGCVLCPMQNETQMLQDIIDYPKYKNIYIKACNKYLENQIEMGNKVSFIDGDDMFNWWVSKLSVEEYLESEKGCYKDRVKRLQQKNKSKLKLE